MTKVDITIDVMWISWPLCLMWWEGYCTTVGFFQTQPPHLMMCQEWDKLKVRSILQNAWPSAFQNCYWPWKTRKDGETVTGQKRLRNCDNKCNVVSYIGSGNRTMSSVEKLVKCKYSVAFGQEECEMMASSCWQMCHGRVRW